VQDLQVLLACKHRRMESTNPTLFPANARAWLRRVPSLTLTIRVIQETIMPKFATSIGSHSVDAFDVADLGMVCVGFVATSSVR
jgi:hypothetical protein